LRELLMAGRLPESYVAPEHLLDLRARVRLRSRAGRSARRMAAADSRGAYHHGHPQKDGPLRMANPAWLERIALPDAARERATVALAMIDALDAQEAPIADPPYLFDLGPEQGREVVDDSRWDGPADQWSSCAVRRSL
jgi:transposase